MVELLRPSPTYENWLRLLFDHPVTDVPERDSHEWGLTPSVSVAHMTRLFTAPRPVTQTYTRDQIGQGLWYLAGGGDKLFAFAMQDESVPWPARQRCIAAMYDLFARLFAVQLRRPVPVADGPFDWFSGACFMWWDIFPFRAWGILKTGSETERARYDREVMKTLERIIELPSNLCRQSVLHGLGHLHDDEPEWVEATIDRFLHANPRTPLRDYALHARAGDVL